MERSNTDEKIAINQKSRKSKAAIAAFILGILSIILFPLTYLLTIILSIIAFLKIKQSNGQLKGKGLAISGLVIPILVLGVAFVIWWQDAGPVPNEFTEADLVQVQPKNEASWDLLQRLNEDIYEKAAPAVGLSAQDLKLLNDLWGNDPSTVEEKFRFIGEHAAEIKLLWNKSQKGREIIEKLNKHDEIADETVPHVESINNFYFNIGYLEKIYHLYSLMQTIKGDDEDGVKNLILFDSVIRMYNVSARPMASKLVCYRTLSKVMDTANDIACNPNISDETLVLLREHFTPLTPEFLSYKNCIFYEYVMFKNTLDSYFTEVMKGFLVKRNSTLRYFHCFCQNWISIEAGQEPAEYCGISVWPWEKPNWPTAFLDESIFDACSYEGPPYVLYNPVGASYMSISMQNFRNMPKIKQTILIRDELLQWVLARRMGKEGSLKARAYSDEYTVDVEKGLVFSVGPDGKAYTDDDIKLQINPKVLGLK